MKTEKGKTAVFAKLKKNVWTFFIISYRSVKSEIKLFKVCLIRLCLKVSSAYMHLPKGFYENHVTWILCTDLSVHDFNMVINTTNMSPYCDIFLVI